MYLSLGLNENKIKKMKLYLKKQTFTRQFFLNLFGMQRKNLLPNFTPGKWRFCTQEKCVWIMFWSGSLAGESLAKLLFIGEGKTPAYKIPMNLERLYF